MYQLTISLKTKSGRLLRVYMAKGFPPHTDARAAHVVSPRACDEICLCTSIRELVPGSISIPCVVQKHNAIKMALLLLFLLL